MSTEATTTQTEGGVSEATTESQSTESIENVASEEAGNEGGAVSAETVESEGGEGKEEAASEEVKTEEPSDRYEVTVDGQKLMLTRDELLKGFQLGAASHKRFQEAAQLRQQAQQALEVIKQNPLEAFVQSGGDPQAFQDFVEKYLYDQISYDKMTPEEKELADLRRYKAEQEQLTLKQQKEQEEQKLQQQTEYYEKEYQQTFSSELEKAGISATPEAIQRVAQIQLAALEQDYELPVELAINQYKNEQTNLINSYLGSLDADKLTEVIGKDRLKEIRKKELASLKNPTPKPQSNVSTEINSTKEKESMSDFLANLGR